MPWRLAKAREHKLPLKGDDDETGALVFLEADGALRETIQRHLGKGLVADPAPEVSLAELGEHEVPVGDDIARPVALVEDGRVPEADDLRELVRSVLPVLADGAHGTALPARDDEVDHGLLGRTLEEGGGFLPRDDLADAEHGRLTREADRPLRTHGTRHGTIAPVASWLSLLPRIPLVALDGNPIATRRTALSTREAKAEKKAPKAKEEVVIPTAEFVKELKEAKPKVLKAEAKKQEAELKKVVKAPKAPKDPKAPKKVKGSYEDNRSCSGSEA